jgi:hypothetical protein
LNSYLEVWGAGGREVRVLDADRLTVGSADSNDLVVDLPGVSGVHAIMERFGDVWCVRDLGSRNGTFVNGARTLSDHALHPDDEITLGRLRLVYRGPGRGRETGPLVEPPKLTQREHEVLLALCKPLLAGDVFTEPASIRAIAAELVVSEAAVKQHLVRLYRKFGLDDGGERRRLQLANVAVTSGAVSLGDLRRPG